MILRTISFGMESMKDQVSSMAASLGTNESNLSNLQSVVKHPENSRPALSRKTALDRLLPPIRSGPPNPRLSVQTELQGQCRPLCLCVCHTESHISIPSWMSDVFGKLFIGYSSIPFMDGSRQKCTESNCHRNDASTLQVDYYFPSWLLQRMFIFRDQVSSPQGHQITIRTPRVVGPSNPIFQVCQDGNIERARTLFSGGLASPFDMDASGATPLAVRNNSCFKSEDHD